jgi:uncharacterized membrane protein
VLSRLAHDIDKALHFIEAELAQEEAQRFREQIIESVAGIFFALMPLLLPVPLMFMGLFFGLIQTFVFTMLSVIYLSGAVATDH